MYDKLSDMAENSDYQQIKLIAIDLDGTVLRDDKTISKRTLQAIQRAKTAGIPVIMVTARPPRSSKAIYEQLGLTTPSIHYNGAYVHDFTTGEELFHQPLAAEIVRIIVEAAREVDPACELTLEIKDKWHTDHHDGTLMTETAKHFPPDVIAPIESFLDMDVTKLMLLTPGEKIPALEEVVEKVAGDQVMMTRSDDHLLQISHPAVEKQAALKRYCDQQGIAAREVMAIGDAPNDCKMIAWAGLGLAVGNAWPQVKAVADEVLLRNDEDGPAIAIERVVNQTI